MENNNISESAMSLVTDIVEKHKYAVKEPNKILSKVLNWADNKKTSGNLYEDVVDATLDYKYSNFQKRDEFLVKIITNPKIKEDTLSNIIFMLKPNLKTGYTPDYFKILPILLKNPKLSKKTIDNTIGALSRLDDPYYKSNLKGSSKFNNLLNSLGEYIEKNDYKELIPKFVNLKFKLTGNVDNKLIGNINTDEMGGEDIARLLDVKLNTKSWPEDVVLLNQEKIESQIYNSNIDIIESISSSRYPDPNSLELLIKYVTIQHENNDDSQKSLRQARKVLKNKNVPEKVKARVRQGILNQKKAKIELSGLNEPLDQHHKGIVYGTVTKIDKDGTFHFQNSSFISSGKLSNLSSKQKKIVQDSFKNQQPIKLEAKNLKLNTRLASDGSISCYSVPLSLENVLKNANENDFIGFLENIPPGSLDEVTVVYDSESSVKDEIDNKILNGDMVNEGNVRIIRKNSSCTITIAYTCNPKNLSYGKVELIGFKDGKLPFYEIDFNKSKKHKIDKNPKSCYKCHTSNAGSNEDDLRHNWREYFNWHGVFGSNDDTISRQPGRGPTTKLQKKEYDLYNMWRKKATQTKNLCLKLTPKITEKEQNIYSEVAAASSGDVNFKRPNLKFTADYISLNFKRLSKKIVNLAENDKSFKLKTLLYSYLLQKNKCKTSEVIEELNLEEMLNSFNMSLLEMSLEKNPQLSSYNGGSGIMTNEGFLVNTITSDALINSPELSNENLNARTFGEEISVESMKCEPKNKPGRIFKGDKKICNALEKKYNEYLNLAGLDNFKEFITELTHKEQISLDQFTCELKIEDVRGIEKPKAIKKCSDCHKFYDVSMTFEASWSLSNEQRSKALTMIKNGSMPQDDDDYPFSEKEKGTILEYFSNLNNEYFNKCNSKLSSNRKGKNVNKKTEEKSSLGKTTVERK